MIINTQQIKHTIPWFSMILLTLFLLGCDKPEQGNTATISIKMADPSATQSAQSPGIRAISGETDDVTQIIITVTNFDSGAVIGSDDLLKSGGALTFTVPAHMNLKLAGSAYKGNILSFQGEVDVPALRPGESTSPNLVLNAVGETLPKPGITLTGSVAAPGFGTGSTIELFAVDQTGTPVGEVIASGFFEDGNVFTITVPTDVEPPINPGSQYVFRATDNPASEGPVAFEARYTNANVSGSNLNINSQTTAVSRLVSKLTTNANVTDISAEVELKEIDELDKIVAEIDRFLDQSNITTVDDYSAAVLAQVDNRMDFRSIAGSIVANGQICGNVELEVPEISTTPQAGIQIQVRDFDTHLIRARTNTIADGSYCVDVPTANEPNVLTGTVDTKGEYIVGAMNYTNNTDNAGSAWWISNNQNAKIRLDAEKIVLPDLTIGIGAAAVINPPLVNFTLLPGALVSGNVSGVTEGLEPLSDVIVIVRDSKTHFMTAAVKTGVNGDYSLNVKPGDYIIEALNTTPALTPQTSKPYASATYTSANLSGSNNRNFGTIVSLTEFNTATPYDFKLQPGVRISGKITEPVNSVATPVVGERVVFNLRAGIQGNGPATRLRNKNVDGSFGVWLKPDNYQVYAHGQNQNADITASATGSTNALTDFAAQVAKVPLNVTTLAPAQTDKLSQMKFELFYVEDGTSLRHTAFSRSDGSLTLYSDLTLDHVVVGRLDQARSSARPYASTVYGGLNNGYTQRDIGKRINLSRGTTEPVLEFNPLQTGGTLSGTVLSTTGQPISNLRVTVRHQVSNNPVDHPAIRFVQTRTKNDGTYVLSLPQATYDSIRFTDTSGVEIAPTDCAFIPVFDTLTTTLNVTFNAVANNGCTPPEIPAPYVRVGNAHFHSTSGADLTQHPLYSNPTANWNLEDMASPGTFLDYIFDIAPVLINGVNTTVRRRQDFSVEVPVSDQLAVEIGGGLYSLDSDAAPVAYTDPVLLIPGELAPGIMWNITDGNLLTPTTLKRGEIVSVGSDSAGNSNPDYVHISYTEDVTAPAIPLVENFYFLRGNGLQQEILVSDPGVPPEIPPTQTIWQRTSGIGV